MKSGGPRALPIPTSPFGLGLCLALVSLATSLSAAVLTEVPMQGSMLMPTVWYHEETDSVTVGLESIIITAQLTPLLVSNPSDRFNPADPWFASLDPSRQGLAFSRRYGFVMHALSDYLPPDRALWIRRIAASPGLSFFDYNDFTPPLTWNPIFGTAGTTNATYWNRVMWHIGVAAPPGTNNYAATFEIFVMDTTSGQPVTNSSSGPFLLEWTCVPDGRPELTIAATATNHVVLTWPASATNWLLVSAPDAAARVWTTNTAPVTTNNARATVVLSNAAPQQFFRLQHHP
jgi:hypothetical protein